MPLHLRALVVILVLAIATFMLARVPITAHALRYQGAYVIPNGSQITVDLSGGFCIAQ